VFEHLKRLLPDRQTPMLVWRGPFRGARVVMNPRTSLRKALGLYEHELNGWLERALGRVTRVIDVGANDGYFTFGCAAALTRRGATAEIIAFEPQAQHVTALRAAAGRQRQHVRIEIVQAMVGRELSASTTTLDAIAAADRENTLVKIDVEGAEVDVIAGAASWLRPSNLFVIEVHRRAYLEQLTSGFAAHGLTLRRIDQQPLPLLGRDVRDADNWWLVSDLR
jgi:predicted RNA methylase